MPTPQQEYEKLRALGLNHQQVMKRMSAANRLLVAKADARQAAGDFDANTYQVGTLDAPPATPAEEEYVDPRGKRPSERKAYDTDYEDPRGKRPSERKA